MPGLSRDEMAAVSEGPVAFARNLIIDVSGTPQPFKPDPWQLVDLERMAPAWQLAAGRYTGSDPPKRFALFEYPRGHSKTTCLAINAAWCLMFAKHPAKGCWGAADRDQAKLGRDAILTLARLNPLVSSILTIDQWCVANPHNGAQLDIISSDAASSYGALLDFIVIDEISHHKSDALYTSLFSTADKRKNCVLQIITNAGFRLHWFYAIRETIKNDPDWIFSRLPGPAASWITEAALNRQRRGLSEDQFKRLWLNQWAEGGEESVFLQSDIDAAFVDIPHFII